MAQHNSGRTAISRTHDAHEGRRDVSSEDRLVDLMERYETPIYTYLLSLLRDREAALDCAQDTFIRAFRALCNDKVINGNWLYTVARNRAMDEFRRKRHFQPDSDQLQDLPARQGSIESALDVQTVMDRLLPLDRDVLYLFEVVGFTTDEIGGMVGTSGNAVRQRLTRARQRFRRLYAPERDENGELEVKQA